MHYHNYNYPHRFFFYVYSYYAYLVILIFEIKYKKQVVYNYSWIGFLRAMHNMQTVHEQKVIF